MKKNFILKLCVASSLGAMALGIALLLAALGPRSTSNWGEVAMAAMPQVVLIVGGLLALAICSISARD